MDKITNYQNIISQLLNDYACFKRSVTPNVTSEVIIDKENNHFMLLSIGWHNQKFVYNVAFHFDIVADKIWLQQNNTDVLIADDLVEMGVEKSDIILGFISPHLREYSGFATAWNPVYTRLKISLDLSEFSWTKYFCAA